MYDNVVIPTKISRVLNPDTQKQINQTPVLTIYPTSECGMCYRLPISLGIKIAMKKDTFLLKFLERSTLFVEKYHFRWSNMGYYQEHEPVCYNNYTFFYFLIFKKIRGVGSKF